MSLTNAINLPKKLDLDNKEFQKAFELLSKTNANVFLTGKAGTGKSTFLSYICRNLKKKYVILAPTGVAAVNVGGVTIHSFFQMPLRPVPPDDPEYSVREFAASKKFSKRKRQLLKELELIIIDEVSMVRPDMIDFIDRALRGVRGDKGSVFGGVQLLLVGDIFQLEPVVTSDTKGILSRYYRDFFFFNAGAYRQANLLSIELKKIYRQTDTEFIGLLDRVRLNKTSALDFHLLNSRVDANALNSIEEKFEIVLAARKDAASIINSEKMEALPGEEYVFKGDIEDDFPEKILPTDLNLQLKVDAQVMLIRNDRERRWVNGTLARIKEISDDRVIVELEDGREVNVEKETWENINYYYDEKEKKVKEEVLGRFTQYPLKAAWALTIHKSQGLTFNNVTIDMGDGAFSAGQTYVALSRCRSMEGLRFVSPLRRYDIIVSHEAREFSRNFNDTEAADKVLRETKARNLSSEAVVDFNNGDMGKAVEKAWEVEELTQAFSKRGVRRWLATKLNLINTLRDKIARQEELLRSLSDEFVEMGDVSLTDGLDIEPARANYEKALSLYSENERAEIGLAKCFIEEGKTKQACKKLDKIIKKKGESCYDASLLKGDIMAEEKDYSRAALNYQTAASQCPDKKEPIERLISISEKAGLHEIADQWRNLLNSM